MRELLDCEQMELESVFVEAKPNLTMTLVHRVELGQGDIQERPSSIVKYSPARYAPARTERLKIATARHYREFEGGGPGIRDEHDAVYRQSIKSFFERWNPDALTLLAPFSTTFTADSRDYTVEVVPSGTVNRAADGEWIYCASLEPRTKAEQDMMFQEFSADSMTRFQHPTDLARELGSAFSRSASAFPVTFDTDVDQLQISAMREQSSLEKIVHVYHGPVAYTDDPEHLIEPIPSLLQGSAVPFLKSPEFGHQREYRFVISTIGAPNEEVLYVPITDDLRDLVLGTEYQSVSVADR